MSDIVNIGICCVDAIGQTVDDFPPPGGLRLFDKLTMTTGGNAVNCSIGLAKMGVACDVIVKVGRDPLGNFIISELERHGLSTAGVKQDDQGMHTPYSFVCVLKDGQRSFFHTVGTNGTLCLEDIDMNIVKQAKFCFVTGAMVMPTFDGRQSAAVLEQAQKAGVVTLLDTVYSDAATCEEWSQCIDPVLPVLDYFVPSQPEARSITGLDKPEDMARYFKDRGCKNVVIKLDENGVLCLADDGSFETVHSYVVDNVVDTTGAGDSWCAGFLAGLQKGMPFAEAALLGNATAAHCIQAPGASTGIADYQKIKEFQQNTPRRK